MPELDDLKQKTAQLLDEGLRSGVLTPEEHSWRHGHLVRVQTVEELDPLVDDLLGESSSGAKVPAVAKVSQVTLMSSRTYSLADLGRRTELVTLMGSTVIHLKDLKPGEPLNLELVTVMGDAQVVVPAGVKVRVECVPIMGDCVVSPEVSSLDAPVRITGPVVMGSLRVVLARP